ncbi:MAG: hypothetical protein IJD48_01190 [Clostridia bacterium]|nr:hypothetical protein [Clostridia bacterium]MBQ3047611.1 hypothetical protein [Clostridia bacterium]
MAAKQQELKEMRAKMYERAESIREDFASFSPLEKVFFAQQAFNDVNAYLCKKYGMPENRVALGFALGLGRRAVGIFHQQFCLEDKRNLSIGLGLHYVASADDPYKIYKVALHEWYHFLQAETGSTLGYFLYKNLYPKEWQRNQTHGRWLLSPIETEADFNAHSQLIAITKAGIQNPETRVRACKQTRFFEKERVANFFSHLSGFTSPIISFLRRICKQETGKNETYQHDKDGPVYFNLDTIAAVMGELPFEVKDPVQFCNIMREFTKVQDPSKFSGMNFFAINREFNQEANRTALENFYQNGGFNIAQPQVPTEEGHVDTYQYSGQNNNAEEEQVDGEQQGGGAQNSSTEEQPVVGNPELTREILRRIAEEKGGVQTVEDGSQTPVPEGASALSLDIEPAMELTE